MTSNLTKVGLTQSQISDLPSPSNLSPLLHQARLLDKESISPSCRRLCKISNSRLGSHDKNLLENIQTP